MSRKLINHNPDLKQLRDEGYEIEVIEQFLILHSVPYVNNNKKVITDGKLISKLEFAGENIRRPITDHIVFFQGEHPCNKDGNVITSIKHASQNKPLLPELEINHSFSNKPSGGYKDYYEKLDNYSNIIVHQAQAIDPSVTAKTFKIIHSNDKDSVFRYTDTNSSRAEILDISTKFIDDKIAIIGLGGTGSYILDFVVKTPVKEIHLYDNDTFYSHNAFRCPGASSVKKLNKMPKKVHYLKQMYSKLRKNIYAHEMYISQDNIRKLSKMSFVFICMDSGTVKKELVDYLVKSNISFIDVGIGIVRNTDTLSGHVRVSTGTKYKNDHLNKHISYNNTEHGAYDTNIQIAELNALNASLAVIKWKKLKGFYSDVKNEHNTLYSLNDNLFISDDINP